MKVRQQASGKHCNKRDVQIQSNPIMFMFTKTNPLSLRYLHITWPYKYPFFSSLSSSKPNFTQKMVTKTHTKCIISPSFLFFLLTGFLVILTGESRPPFACDPNNRVTSNLPFCRVNLPIRTRVRDLLGRLTLQEKVRLLVNNAAAVPRLGIQGYEWWSEALHGVSDVGPGTKFLPTFLGATQFPQVITTASSFNDTLWEEIGQVMWHINSLLSFVW